MHITKSTLVLGLALLLTQGCGSGGGNGETGGGGPPAFQLGDPIDGLTADELAAFERGRVVFERRFTPSEGLGPFYNATSCASCHSTPVAGGSARLYRNFYIAVHGPPIDQRTLPPFLSPVIPAYGSGNQHLLSDFELEGGRAGIPAMFMGQNVTVAQRNAIPLFGTGLFEFISDATILAGADPDDADVDGISGRANMQALPDPPFFAVGRFGVKAQANNVELFTRPPLQNQMGITTDPFDGSGGIVSLAAAPVQDTGDPNAATEDNDGVPDPEMSRADLGDLIAFSRFLGPPRKQTFDAAATNGEQLFEQIGCTDCHFPSLPSTRGDVEAYTDLLLHYMGPDLADGLSFGVPQPGMAPNSPTTSDLEFRTQPLWGVSLHGPWLHDGRAETLREAIDLHAGEGLASRDAFVALTVTEQDDVLAFLEAL